MSEEKKETETKTENKDEKELKKAFGGLLHDILTDIYADLNKEEIEKCAKTAAEKYGSLVKTGKEVGLTLEYMFLSVLVIVSSEGDGGALFTKLATDMAAKELGIEKYAKDEKEA